MPCILVQEIIIGYYYYLKIGNERLRESGCTLSVQRPQPYIANPHKEGSERERQSMVTNLDIFI